uniref:Galaxin-like repeats domain-containing protein n=1 Tax=Magallana gigas TaxID=29159 RepID=A0A8W8JFK8_MAGGI
MDVLYQICIWFVVCLLRCITTVNAESCLTFSRGVPHLESYNRETKVCCNNTLFDRIKDSDEELDCCGGVIYRTLDKICCQSNSLHERYVQSGKNQGKEQICCGANIFQVDQIVGMSCCGNSYTKNDGCCNQTTPLNRTHSRCVRDKVVPLGHDYCNGTLFNRQTQKCCEDSSLWTISSYDGYFHCCGSEVYDQRTKQCCRGSGEKKIQPKNGQCCGTGLYDSSKELCCKTQVFPSDGRLHCCGKGTYDPSHQECCHGTNFSTAMQQGQQICCDGTVYTTNYNSKLHCCGNNVYYSTTHLCCENRSTIEKTLPDHTSCCKKNATSFYSCKNQEKKKSDFCGRQSYDKKSDLCCNNEIHTGAHKMGKRCCNPGTLAYDPRNQICCHGEVKRIAESCNSPSPSGLCSIWSQPKTQRIGFINSTADVCRKNGYILKIENPIRVSNLSPQLHISYLDVTVKANIYNSTNVPSKKEQHTLLIPSNCTNMDKLKKKSFLLLTDIALRSSQNIVHLGDSDLIFPPRRKIVQIVKRRFKSCSSYIVRNIHKILRG